MASVLGIGEAIKFVIALGCIGMWSSASEAPAGPFTSRLIYLISHSGKMAVPAFLYLAMNMLGFVSLRRLDAGTFAIIQQSKVFFTALFQRLLLQRKLSIPKWCALILLVLGVTLISLMAQPSNNGCGLKGRGRPRRSDRPRLAPRRLQRRRPRQVTASPRTQLECSLSPPTPR